MIRRYGAWAAKRGQRGGSALCGKAGPLCIDRPKLQAEVAIESSWLWHISYVSLGAVLVAEPLLLDIPQSPSNVMFLSKGPLIDGAESAGGIRVKASSRRLSASRSSC